MKCLVALLILSAALLPPARAQNGGPDDQYIIIYTLMQQADSSDSSGQPRQALAQYVQVQGELQKFQKIYPDWNPRIVSFRLNYLAEKIAEVTAKLPVVPPSGTPSPAPPAPGAALSASAADLAAQLGALHEQVQRLQADNTTLQSKLKEALGAQPAAIDSRELTRARETIRSLMKENDLLKVSLSQGKTGTAPGGAGAEFTAAICNCRTRFSRAAFSRKPTSAAACNAAIRFRAASSSAFRRAASAGFGAAGFKPASCFLSNAFSSRNAAIASGPASNAWTRDCNA